MEHLRLLIHRDSVEIFDSIHPLVKPLFRSVTVKTEMFLGVLKPLSDMQSKSENPRRLRLR